MCPENINQKVTIQSGFLISSRNERPYVWVREKRENRHPILRLLPTLFPLA
jgi:hypothetical protein